jgi:hypothetical protein
VVLGAARAQQSQNPSPMVEHTRAHPRLKEQSPPGRREKLVLGTLFLPVGMKTTLSGGDETRVVSFENPLYLLN